jgi:hypothetical protein
LAANSPSPNRYSPILFVGLGVATLVVTGFGSKLMTRPSSNVTLTREHEDSPEFEIPSGIVLSLMQKENSNRWSVNHVQHSMVDGVLILHFL